MSRKLERALRRQDAIRESRDIAWMLFVVMLPIAYFGLVGILQSMETAGTALTVGGIAGGVVGLIASWVALHLAREALRLGRLLKDPRLVMRLEESTDLVSGVRWSGLNPFKWWKG